MMSMFNSISARTNWVNDAFTPAASACCSRAKRFCACRCRRRPACRASPDTRASRRSNRTLNSRRDEAQLHQLAGGVIDEGQQRAHVATGFEPSHVPSLDDLHQARPPRHSRRRRAVGAGRALCGDGQSTGPRRSSNHATSLGTPRSHAVRPASRAAKGSERNRHTAPAPASPRGRGPQAVPVVCLYFGHDASISNDSAALSCFKATQQAKHLATTKKPCSNAGINDPRDEPD